MSVRTAAPVLGRPYPGFCAGEDFFPDTATHTLAIVDRLHAGTGLRVLTANQVAVWEGLRLAGGDSLIGGLPDVGLGGLFGVRATGAAP